MNVDYVEHMGSDLTVVNAARVSFAKHHDVFDHTDERLLKYLAAHQHWTPFAHPQITLRLKAPIFVRTQCFKHKQGFVENEISRRYVDTDPEFYFPEVWRPRPANGMKQGSGYGHIIDSDELSVKEYCDKALKYYKELLSRDVAPEMARMVLPQNTYTEWYWTGSLAAYARFYKQRVGHTAQLETHILAKKVGDIIKDLFPVSWKVLTNE